MMFKRLVIKNFRGIKNADLSFGRTNILLGNGDSTKTTILMAMDLVTTQSVQPSISINDYYKSDSKNEILIEAYITGFPEEFLSEEKFGLYLLDEYKDEPTLKIRFSANSDLETAITISKDGLEDKQFGLKFRKLVSAIYFDTNYDKNFFYGKYSMLNDFADVTNLQHELKKTINENSFVINNDGFKSISSAIENVAKKYSVYGIENVETRLDKSLISASASSLGLFSDNVLISKKGCSDKKTLSIGLLLEQNLNYNPILIDEIENSLEPYKVRFLVKQLYNYSKSKNAQIIITTHSPFCVGQADVEDIKIVRNKEGETTFTGIPVELRQVVYEKTAEAIFAKKIIALEGNTELGYIDALNDHLMQNDVSLAYYGTSVVRFEGDKIAESATKLLDIGYPVLLVMDNDVAAEKSKMETFVAKGGTLVTYKDGYDIEMACFEALSKEELNDCFKQLDDYPEFCEKANSVFSTSHKTICELYEEYTDNFVNKICKCATKKYFKNYRFGRVLYEHMATKDSDCYMQQKNAEIKDWIKQ